MRRIQNYVVVGQRPDGTVFSHRADAASADHAMVAVAKYLRGLDVSILCAVQTDKAYAMLADKHGSSPVHVSQLNREDRDDD